MARLRVRLELVPSDKICNREADQQRHDGSDRAKSECGEEVSEIGRSEEFQVVGDGVGGIGGGSDTAGHVELEAFAEYAAERQDEEQREHR